MQHEELGAAIQLSRALILKQLPEDSEVHVVVCTKKDKKNVIAVIQDNGVYADDLRKLTMEGGEVNIES